MPIVHRYNPLPWLFFMACSLTFTMIHHNQRRENIYCTESIRARYCVVTSWLNFSHGVWKPLGSYSATDPWTSSMESTHGWESFQIFLNCCRWILANAHKLEEISNITWISWQFNYYCNCSIWVYFLYWGYFYVLVCLIVNNEECWLQWQNKTTLPEAQRTQGIGSVIWINFLNELNLYHF